MALEKMTITGYSNKTFSQKNGDSFVVMINPEKYNHSHSLNHTKDKAQGKAAKVTKFESVDAEEVSFDFMLDTTGAVPINEENTDKTVYEIIQSLKDVVYKYYGDTHEPNYVMLNWGTMSFNCRLTSLKVDYQMFHTSGVPLRAKVSLSFLSYVDPELESKLANRSSPDLTHIIVVQEGDSLPYLCHKVYKNNRYYMEVAKINKLVNIRQLTVGSKLTFPPLN